MKNRKKLRRQKKRGDVARTMQALALTGLLLGGTAGMAYAADNISIDNNHAVANDKKEVYDGIAVNKGGSLVIELTGKVTGTDVTVNAGGVITSVKNLHFGSFGAQEPDTGLLAKTLTIKGGTVTAEHMGLADDGRVNITGENSKLALQTLDLNAGQIVIDNAGTDPDGDDARLTFTKDTTLSVSQIGATAADGTIALQNGSKLRVEGELILKTTAESTTLHSGGDVKAYSLKVLDKDGKVGDLTVTGIQPTQPNLWSSNGRLSITGASSANPLADVVTAGTITAKDYGLITIGGDRLLEEKNYRGTINANLTADQNGFISVSGLDWRMAKDKTLDVKSGGGFSAVNFLGTWAEQQLNGPTLGPVSFDVSAGTVKVDAFASQWFVAQRAALTAKFSDFGTLDSNNVLQKDGNTHVQKKLALGGTLVLVGEAGRELTLDQMKALGLALTGHDTDGKWGTLEMKGAVIKISDTDTLTEVANAHVSVSDTVVKAGNITGDAAAVVGGVAAGDVAISGGASLGLTGQGAANGQLAQGDITLNSGALTLGNVASVSNGGTLSGSIDASGSALRNTINVLNGAYTVTGDILGGSGVDTLAVANGSLKTQKLDLGAGNDVVVVAANGALHAASVKGTDKTIIGVGDANGGGSLVAADVTMSGGQINFDPAFAAAGDTSNASLGGLTFASSKVDALMNVGQNSMVSLGSGDAEWLRNEVTRFQNDGKGLWGKDITAALAIRAPQTLDAAGGIKVDGTWTHGSPSIAANKAEFADKSLLVIDAAGVGSKVALSGATGGASTLTVNKGAKLHIVGGQGGDSLHITDGFGASTKDAAAWTGSNLTTNTGLLAAKGGAFNAANGSYSVTLEAQAATGVFPMLSSQMAGLVDSVFAQTRVDVNASHAGVRFLSRAVSDNYIGRSDATQAAATIEGAAQMAVAGAVPSMTLSALNAATNAVTTRTSFASPLLDKTKAVAVNMDQNGTLSLDSGLSAGTGPNGGMKNGLGVWIMPLYQSENVWGMKAENFKTGYNSDLGGVALGADYTFADAFRVGVALNLGGGYAQSSGDFNKTDNSFNFWGVGLYGGWTQDNFGLTADVGYSSNYNKVKQELPQAMQMGELKADVTSYAITAGLRGEYKFETSVLDIVPHISARYTSLNTDSYDVKNGGTVFGVDQAHQSLWTFPVGVTFSKDVEMSNGWVFKPQVDLAVIPAAGDVKAKSKSHVPGVGSKAELETQVVDTLTWQGGLGFDVKNDSLSFGVNYNIQASEHRTGHGVFGTVRYEF